MSSQNTFGKVRLNDKVESRVRGDLYARFGGECLETYHCNKWQGAGCLAYGIHRVGDELFAVGGKYLDERIGESVTDHKIDDT